MRINPRGVDVGQDVYYGAGVGWENLVLGVGHDEYTSLITHQTTVNDNPAGMITLFSASAYLGVGGTFSGYWDMNYVMTRMGQIW